MVLGHLHQLLDKVLLGKGTPSRGKRLLLMSPSMPSVPSPPILPIPPANCKSPSQQASAGSSCSSPPLFVPQQGAMLAGGGDNAWVPRLGQTPAGEDGWQFGEGAHPPDPILILTVISTAPW